MHFFWCPFEATCRALTLFPFFPSTHVKAVFGGAFRIISGCSAQPSKLSGSSGFTASGFCSFCASVLFYSPAGAPSENPQPLQQWSSSSCGSQQQPRSLHGHGRHHSQPELCRRGWRPAPATDGCWKFKPGSAAVADSQHAAPCSPRPFKKCRSKAWSSSTASATLWSAPESPASAWQHTRSEASVFWYQLRQPQCTESLGHPHPEWSCALPPREPDRGPGTGRVFSPATHRLLPAALLKLSSQALSPPLGHSTLRAV